MAGQGPQIKVIREAWADSDQPLPGYETSGAAGADIRANFPTDKRGVGYVLAPMARALLPTGLRMECPAGYEIQVRPRSGIALKHGVTLLNTPGTIDSDYRGPIGIMLINLGAEPFSVTHGMRIAQLVVAPVVQARFEARAMLSESERGSGGFGSTGTE